MSSSNTSSRRIGLVDAIEKYQAQGKRRRKREWEGKKSFPIPLRFLQCLSQAIFFTLPQFSVFLTYFAKRIDDKNAIDGIQTRVAWFAEVDRSIHVVR